MNGPPDATAVSGDTHPWALHRHSGRRIMPELLRGAEPVCLDCRQPIPAGAARVSVRRADWPTQLFWRCGDCEYRQVHG